MFLSDAMKVVITMRSNANDLIRPGKGFVRSGDQVYVTVGRNAGNDPLSDSNWDLFITSVSGRLSTLLGATAVYGPFYGQGTWTDDNGVTIHEESAVISITVGYTARFEDVESVLSQLASDYHQDAIAWTHGTGNLTRA